MLIYRQISLPISGCKDRTLALGYILVLNHSGRYQSMELDLGIFDSMLRKTLRSLLIRMS